VPQKAPDSISEHAFLNIFLEGIPPDPPRRLMLGISECAAHTAGEPTYI